MKIAIYGRLLHDEDTRFIQQLFDILSKKNIEVIVYEGFYNHLVQRIKFTKPIDTFKSHNEITKNIDYMFSLGGDGTLLDTLTLVRESEIPIMGINMGSLGYLASIGKEDINKAIEAIEKGTFIKDKRSLIRLESNKPLFKEVNYALNEFTIHSKDTSTVITIHVYIDGDYLNSYWASGIIVATPTGSTAYSLSCGGPIIFPKSESFVITPIAPHNLSVRPIIVSDESVISFKIEGRSKNFLCTLDSRFETVDTTYQLAVKKEKFNINLVRLNDENFFTTLRSKLTWGLDKRINIEKYQ